MKLEEVKARIVEKTKNIEYDKNSLEVLKQQYADTSFPFNIGDKVRLKDGEEVFIASVGYDDGKFSDGNVKVDAFKIKNNGEPYKVSFELWESRYGKISDWELVT